jgi:hypothetical protein
LTIHLPWQILASITRMPGPGSHCGLISIQSDVGKPVRRNNPAIQAARKSRQTRPVLKAQADLLVEAETGVTDWLRRYHEAVVDTQQLVSHLRTSKDPFDALKVQQEWMSRAFLRMAADTTAYQAATRQLTERAKTWFPQSKAFTDSVAAAASADSVASQAAAVTRAAAKPLREANKSA